MVVSSRSQTQIFFMKKVWFTPNLWNFKENYVNLSHNYFLIIKIRNRYQISYKNVTGCSIWSYLVIICSSYYFYYLFKNNRVKIEPFILYKCWNLGPRWYYRASLRIKYQTFWVWDLDDTTLQVEGPKFQKSQVWDLDDTTVQV
jgi:hypothetical protein